MLLERHQSNNEPKTLLRPPLGISALNEFRAEKFRIGHAFVNVSISITIKTLWKFK